MECDVEVENSDIAVFNLDVLVEKCERVVFNLDVVVFNSDVVIKKCDVVVFNLDVLVEKCERVVFNLDDVVGKCGRVVFNIDVAIEKSAAAFLMVTRDRWAASRRVCGVSRGLRFAGVFSPPLSSNQGQNGGLKPTLRPRVCKLNCEDLSQLMIELRRPRADDEGAFLEARSAVPADNPTFLRDYRQGMAFGDFLRLLEDYRVGRGLPPDVAPSSFLFAFDRGRIVGRASIRHTLIPPLGNVAGHIGYAVLPEFRNRGYATQILRAAVHFAQNELGLDRVLVTCDDDNAASIRVIEKSRGVFDGIYHDATLRHPKRRYWIDAFELRPEK